VVVDSIEAVVLLPSLAQAAVLEVLAAVTRLVVVVITLFGMLLDRAGGNFVAVHHTNKRSTTGCCQRAWRQEGTDSPKMAENPKVHFLSPKALEPLSYNKR
jgi:hypothetical protein